MEWKLEGECSGGGVEGKGSEEGVELEESK